jgi:ABC-2 type transport system permease protein
MVALIAVPIFSAYGIIYEGGWIFPVLAAGVLLPMLIVPTVIGSAVTLILVNVFPARRARDLLAVIAVAAAGGLVLVLRVIRPEQLARPEGFRSLLDFITVLRTPTSPLLPSEWATKAIMGYLVGPFDALPLLLLWSTAAVAVTIGAALHARLFASGFTKAQEGAERFVKGWIWRAVLGPLFKDLPVAKREFVIKDLKLFFRDTTQWSQLILLAVLVVIYLFNIKALPLFTGERVPVFFVSLVSFLNLGLAGFVLASIAARFIFPAVSLEGRQMWLLRSSPLDLRALLWSKYWVGTVPLLALALVITISTNLLLKTSSFMMGMSIGTIVLLTLAISAMALAFGALYPQFETENAAQIPTSFGGLVFMMTTIALLAVVIVLEAVPVSGYLRAEYDGDPLIVTPWMLLAFAGVIGICATAVVLPLRVGLKRMESFEF